MSFLITPANITFTLGIIGVIFTIYNYFRNPQEALDKKQALMEKEVDDRTSVLAKQLEWEKTSNERRFAVIEDALKTGSTLSQNHIHTVDVKVDSLRVDVNSMGQQIVKLTTIIDERIPKK